MVFFFKLKKYEKKKKTHTMLYLMLNHTIKNLHLMFSFIGFEQGKAIIEKYDKKPCIPCH
jgi:hypothetical protein